MSKLSQLKFLWGIFWLPIVGIFFIISLPGIFWRFIVTKILAPFNSKLGKPLTAISIVFGIELNLRGRQNQKCGLLTNVTLNGHIPVNELKSEVLRKWVRKRNKTAFFYPELQQYVESWMGFLFWKRDENFDIENHIRSHIIQENDDPEVFVNNLIEKLLNYQFPPKRSPWLLHVVHNYRNQDLQPSSEKITILIFHNNHCLGGGFSIQSLFMEDLFGIDIKSMQQKSLKFSKKCNRKYEPSISSIVKNSVLFLVNFFNETGYLCKFFFDFKQPFRVSLKEKAVSCQFFARSPLISLDKLKTIRKDLNVTITEVLVSCISAGVSKIMDSKKNGPENFHNEIPIATLVPLPNHPKGLHNHFSVANQKLFTERGVTPKERLAGAVKSVADLKNSVVPLLWWPIMNSFMDCQLTPVALQTTRIRLFPIVFSNFFVPPIELYYNDRHKVRSAEVSVGVTQSTTGIFFAVMSYNNWIRINISADSTVLEKKDVNLLLSYVIEELESLFEIVAKDT